MGRKSLAPRTQEPHPPQREVSCEQSARPRPRAPTNVADNGAPPQSLRDTGSPGHRSHANAVSSHTAAAAERFVGEG